MLAWISVWGVGGFKLQVLVLTWESLRLSEEELVSYIVVEV